jgi:transcriptional regulator GlxA family with amidase domain
VLLGVAVYTFIVMRQKRLISQKNQSLAAQITEAMIYKEKYNNEMARMVATADKTPDVNTLTDEQLFQYINDVIVRDRLFLDSRFDRQTIMERFQLTKERVGSAFAKGSQYAKLTDYTQELRLEYSTQLIADHPEKSISQVASDSGFSSYSYYCKCFRQRFGMTPSEFRTSSSKDM